MKQRVTGRTHPHMFHPESIRTGLFITRDSNRDRGFRDVVRSTAKRNRHNRTWISVNIPRTGSFAAVNVISRLGQDNPNYTIHLRVGLGFSRTGQLLSVAFGVLADPTGDDIYNQLTDINPSFTRFEIHVLSKKVEISPSDAVILRFYGVTIKPIDGDDDDDEDEDEDEDDDCGYA